MKYCIRFPYNLIVKTLWIQIFWLSRRSHDDRLRLKFSDNILTARFELQCIAINYSLEGLYNSVVLKGAAANLDCETFNYLD